MKPIKFGICGLGRMGCTHARFFSQEKDKYQLVAGCDRDPERTSKLQADFGCKVYSELDAFFGDPDMELAIIATRSLDHADHAERALAAGKIVLLEKPIAVTSGDFEKLKKLDGMHPGRLFFLHNHRFEPAFQSIRKFLSGGDLGDLQMVKIRRHHPFRRRGDWQTLLACGGGQLSCWGPHIIDQGLQFLRSPVKQIWSHLKRISSLGDADDHVKILLVGENDVVVDLEISDAVVLPEPYITVYGSRGSLVCSDEKTFHVKCIDPGFQLPEGTANPDQPPSGRGGLGYDEEIPWIHQEVKVEPEGNMWDLVEWEIVRHLYRVIRENVPFPIVNADALEVVRVTEMVKKQNPQFPWL